MMMKYLARRAVVPDTGMDDDGDTSAGYGAGNGYHDDGALAQTMMGYGVPVTDDDAGAWDGYGSAAPSMMIALLLCRVRAGAEWSAEIMMMLSAKQG